MAMFSEEQKRELSAPLSRAVVKTRKQGGRDVSYIQIWHAIMECNRIFNHDGWSCETVQIECVAAHEREIGEAKRPGFGVTYTAKVRITVGNVIREGVGAGHGIDVDLGQAHESALKEAESDAQKRALRTFGNVFGLALYDQTQANVADEHAIAYTRYIEETRAKILAMVGRDVLVWWNTEEQKKARRDWEVTAADLILLKELVVAQSHKMKEAS